jgi:hypothetical protein
MSILNHPSVFVWFGFCAFFAISSAIHLVHIKNCGPTEYQQELISKYHLTALEAEKRMRWQILFNWSLAIICGVAALVLLYFSILQIHNAK